MASKRHLRRKQCERKRRYDSEDAAWRAARSLRRAKAETNIEAYPCQHCRGYHVGHCSTGAYGRHRAP